MPGMPPGMPPGDSPLKPSTPPEPAAAASPVAIGSAPLWGYLDNGMGYILLESHAAPLIGSSVIVHSGSAREDFATSGASHFLEHLLFNGTETRTQEQLYADVDAIGGYNNAATTKTHVVYMMVTPAETFRKGLEIQKDMLFHSTLPPEKVEKERGIILDELAKDRDAGSFDSDRLLDLIAFGPTGTGLPTLGSPQSIRTITRDAIAGFYHALYTPQNMTLVIIGDFDSRSMEIEAREVFGGEPGGPVPPGFHASEPVWDPSPVVDSYDGESTFLEWTWPGPDPRSTDFTSAECVASLLSGDDSAPLNRLVRDRFAGKIRSCVGRIEAVPGRSFYRYRIEADPSVDWRAIEQALPFLIEKARLTPPNVKDIDAWKVSEEAQEFFLREKPHYYGVMEGERIATEGIDGIIRRPGRLQALSQLQIASALAGWAKGGYRLGVLVPRPQIAPADSSRAPAGRSVRTTLPNGIDMLVLSSPESPVLALHLFVKGRSQVEPAGLDGAVELLQRLMPVRTKTSDPPALTRRIRSMGAELTTADNPDIPYDDFYSVPEYSFVKLQTLDRCASDAFGLLEDMLSSPSWTDQEFEEARQSMLSYAERSAMGAGATARAVVHSTLWNGRPRSRAVFGTPATLKAMTPAALRGLAGSLYVGHRMLLVVATSLPPDEIVRLAGSTIARLSPGEAPPPRDGRVGATAAIRVAMASSDSLPQEIGVTALPESTLVRVRKIGGRQASVIWVRALGTIGESDRAVGDVWNAALSSQIQFQLREREGLAYSIGSSIDRLDDGTLLWSASAGTAAKNISRILAGFRQALDGALAQAPDSSEVRKQGAQLYGSSLRRRASRMNHAYAAGLAIIEGRDPAGIDDEIRAPMRVTPDEVRARIRSFRPGPGLVVIAY